MKINIIARAGAKENKIEQVGKNVYKVWLTSAPEKGKANKALIAMLADYFSTPKSDIEIIKGNKSKNKVLIISG